MDNGTISILTLAAYLAATAITIIILRLALSIPSRIKIAKAQTKILAEIAKVQGVDADVIDGIFREMNF